MTASWDRRSGSVYRARNAIKQLTARGIALPDDVTAALAVLDRIDADPPKQPERTAVRDAILDGAKRTDIDRLLLADLAFTRHQSEHGQACQVAARRVLEALLADRASIHADLADLAGDAIDKLNAVAALDGASLEVLVREGRHDDAQNLANVDTVGAELLALYECRDLYLMPGGPAATRAGHIDCTTYRDPRIATRNHRSDLDVTANFLHALRNGAELWYPTAEQAHAAAAPIYAEMQREATRVAAKQNAVGGLAAF